MALRLAYRLALAGPRHEQRKHVVHTSEHRDVPLLSPDAIVEDIGGVHRDLPQASRARHAFPASTGPHTCNMRRLIRRFCSAVSRISAKTNSIRSSQEMCPR